MCDPPAGPAERSTESRGVQHLAVTGSQQPGRPAGTGRGPTAGRGLHLHQHDIRGMNPTALSGPLAFMLAAAALRLHPGSGRHHDAPRPPSLPRHSRPKPLSAAGTVSDSDSTPGPARAQAE